MISAILYTQMTKDKGWGVFTTDFIPAGEIVEISPVVVMNADEKILLDQTRLYNYIFDWENGGCCMAMGLISVYNHAQPSNCEYFQDYEAQTITIKTVREISPGEELTINYNGDFDCDRPVWFKVSHS